MSRVAARSLWSPGALAADRMAPDALVSLVARIGEHTPCALFVAQFAVWYSLKTVLRGGRPFASELACRDDRRLCDPVRSRGAIRPAGTTEHGVSVHRPPSSAPLAQTRVLGIAARAPARVECAAAGMIAGGIPAVGYFELCARCHEQP